MLLTRTNLSFPHLAQKKLNRHYRRGSLPLIAQPPALLQQEAELYPAEIPKQE